MNPERTQDRSSYIGLAVIVFGTLAWAAKILMQANESHEANAEEVVVSIGTRWIAADVGGDGVPDWLAFESSSGGTLVRVFGGSDVSPRWQVELPGDFVPHIAPPLFVGDTVLMPMGGTPLRLVHLRLDDGAVLSKRDMPGRSWSTSSPITGTDDTELVAVVGADGSVTVLVLDSDDLSTRWTRSFVGEIDEVGWPVRAVSGALLIPMDGWLQPIAEQAEQLRPETGGSETFLTPRGETVLVQRATAAPPSLAVWSSQHGGFQPRADARLAGLSEMTTVVPYADRMVALDPVAATPVLHVRADAGSRAVPLPEGHALVGASLLSGDAGRRGADCLGKARFVLLWTRLGGASSASPSPTVVAFVVDTREAEVTWRSPPYSAQSPMDVASRTFCADGLILAPIPAESGGGTRELSLLRVDSRNGSVDAVSFGPVDGFGRDETGLHAVQRTLGAILLGAGPSGPFAVDLRHVRVILDPSGTLAMQTRSLHKPSAGERLATPQWQ